MNEEDGEEFLNIINHLSGYEALALIAMFSLAALVLFAHWFGSSGQR